MLRLAERSTGYAGAFHVAPYQFIRVQLRGVAGKVALEALRGELTAAQLASKHGIHQTMVGEWKKQAMEGLAAACPIFRVNERATKTTFTQATAQFAVVSELGKRGYAVSGRDLTVVSPEEQTEFLVVARGVRDENYFQSVRREPRDNLFYILAQVPDCPTSVETNQRVDTTASSILT